MKDGHIRPLPSAKNMTATYAKAVLLATKRIKFIPKITLPIITNFSSKNIWRAFRRTGPTILSCRKRILN
jgi:hypothetical protein